MFFFDWYPPKYVARLEKDIENLQAQLKTSQDNERIWRELYTKKLEDRPVPVRPVRFVAPQGKQQPAEVKRPQVRGWIQARDQAENLSESKEV